MSAAPIEPGHEGSYAMYQRGCRCGGCAAANRAAGTHRTRMMAYGRWQPFVDAEPARQHITEVVRPAGIGYDRVAQLAGLSPGVISGLLFGRGRSGAPARRIRPETEAKILAVRPTDTPAPGARIDATGTQRRVQALVAKGWAQARIAEQLGMNRTNLSQLMTAGHVTQAMADRVRAVTERMWDTEPPATTRAERIDRTRALRIARERNWAPLAAWDDGDIDNPAAKPADGWRRPERRTRPGAELLAEADELARMGLDRNQAAERLGVSRDALDAAYSRAARKEADQRGRHREVEAAARQLTRIHQPQPQAVAEADAQPQAEVA